jgi:hypothetical protein
MFAQSEGTPVLFCGVNPHGSCRSTQRRKRSELVRTHNETLAHNSRPQQETLRDLSGIWVWDVVYSAFLSLKFSLVTDDGRVEVVAEGARDKVVLFLSHSVSLIRIQYHLCRG